MGTNTEESEEQMNVVFKLSLSYKLIQELLESPLTTAYRRGLVHL